MIGVENKTVNRPNDNYEIINVVEKGVETDQFNKNKDDQVADNNVSYANLSESNQELMKKLLAMIDEMLKTR